MEQKADCRDLRPAARLLRPRNQVHLWRNPQDAQVGAKSWFIHIYIYIHTYYSSYYCHYYDYYYDCIIILIIITIIVITIIIVFCDHSITTIPVIATTIILLKPLRLRACLRPKCLEPWAWSQRPSGPEGFAAAKFL